MDADGVRDGRQLIGRVRIADTLGLGGLGRETAGAGHDLHFQPSGTRGDRLADGPKTEDAQGAAGQAAGLAEFFLSPSAVAQGHGRIDDAAIGGHQQPDRQLRDGRGVLAGTIGDVDAAVACGRQVDRVYARPGADDQREPRRGLDRRRGDLCGAHDENIRRPHGGRQCRSIQVIADLDLQAKFLQRTHDFRGHFVDNQDIHGITCC